jgi:hypothetical protein
MRVVAVGFPSNQATARLRIIAVAVATFCRCVFSNALVAMPTADGWHGGRPCAALGMSLGHSTWAGYERKVNLFRRPIGQDDADDPTPFW